MNCARCPLFLKIAIHENAIAQEPTVLVYKASHKPFAQIKENNSLSFYSCVEDSISFVNLNYHEMLKSWDRKD